MAIRGTIVRWNRKGGYGFVLMEDGHEAFLHVSSVEPQQPRFVDLEGKRITVRRLYESKEGRRIGSAILVELQGLKFVFLGESENGWMVAVRDNGDHLTFGFPITVSWRQDDSVVKTLRVGYSTKYRIYPDSIWYARMDKKPLGDITLPIDCENLAIVEYDGQETLGFLKKNGEWLIVHASRWEVTGSEKRRVSSIRVRTTSAPVRILERLVITGEQISRSLDPLELEGSFLFHTVSEDQYKRLRELPLEKLLAPDHYAQEEIRRSFSTHPGKAAEQIFLVLEAKYGGWGKWRGLRAVELDSDKYPSYSDGSRVFNALRKALEHASEEAVKLGLAEEILGLDWRTFVFHPPKDAFGESQDFSLLIDHYVVARSG